VINNREVTCGTDNIWRLCAFLSNKWELPRKVHPNTEVLRWKFSDNKHDFSYFPQCKYVRFELSCTFVYLLNNFHVWLLPRRRTSHFSRGAPASNGIGNPRNLSVHKVVYSLIARRSITFNNLKYLFILALLNTCFQHAQPK